MSSTSAARAERLRVVVFSGGRGSGALVRQLVAHAGVSLTVAINGYDDGASTGEVRRFLGDSLGPSDFRKNASRLAAELQTSAAGRMAILDERLPPGTSAADAVARLTAIDAAKVGTEAVAYLKAFLDAYRGSGRSFEFGDCSIGNLVFAGAFLACGRHFNAAVDAYSALCGLPAGLIEDVTDGRDAYLVAIDVNGRILRNEAEIVGARGANRVDRIYLIDRPLTEEEGARLEAAGPAAAAAAFAAREAPIGLNPRLAGAIAAADVIVYAPGTQHSSLFPSYLTPGLADAIAGNLRAIKLLVTNIQTDAEITGSTAVDLIDRALHYLNLKAVRRLPTPCLITHYLMNDPGHAESAPYVPLGPVETIEDPRLVRIGDYEDGITGRHDAARILGPFIEALLAPRRPYRLAVLLHDAGSLNKITQTLLEMIRGGIDRLPTELTVFYQAPDALDPAFVAGLPFVVRATAGEPAFRDAVRAGDFDYVALFESSGMYRGEDLVGLASHLTVGRLDAVWGSRRLSVRDIRESYRLRYRRNVALGAVSYLGSHALSLAYLVLYGRYISDTLSGVRAIRASTALEAAVPLTHKRANQYLLSGLLRRRAEILELPVGFFPISPERVKRTSPFEGLQSLATIVWQRFLGFGL
ncbi:MAG TPA: 2-phospho-L-lactate transferase CofD family protein [Vicinamibacterales bacterium]|nr:2-phospho-L-lactate transferase CofD family protein [Vicinamibacterales bacterium]